AGLLAIAVLGIVMTHAFDAALGERLAGVQASRPVLEAVARQRQKLAAIELPADADPQGAAAARRAIAESYVEGFRAVMLASASPGALGTTSTSTSRISPATMPRARCARSSARRRSAAGTACPASSSARSAGLS